MSLTPYEAQIDYNQTIKPFIRWAGGKRQLLPELVKRMPQKPIKRYYEPFLGGGALFLALSHWIQEAYLSDLNYDLMLTWRTVQRQVNPLLFLLRHHEEKHSSEYYYQLRNHNNLIDPLEQAARFIYLNKTCFNGIYRVNKDGVFNVPVGSPRKNIADKLNLSQCAQALNGVNLRCRDYREIEASQGDSVYFDPPYHFVDNKGFTGYTAGGFTTKDQKSLHDFAVELHKKGVFVMLSNSDTPFIRSLYPETFFKIDGLLVGRSINHSKAKEVIITNY